MIDWDAMVLGPVMAQFQEPVTYLPRSGVARALHGVFDDACAHEVVLQDGSVGWTTASPTLGIRLNEWHALPRQGEQVIVSGMRKTYVIREARQDSHGGARLMLAETA